MISRCSPQGFAIRAPGDLGKQPGSQPRQGIIYTAVNPAFNYTQFNCNFISHRVADKDSTADIKRCRAAITPAISSGVSARISTDKPLCRDQNAGISSVLIADQCHTHRFQIFAGTRQIKDGLLASADRGNRRYRQFMQIGRNIHTVGNVTMNPADTPVANTPIPACRAGSWLPIRWWPAVGAASDPESATGRSRPESF